ncbi:MAG: hypothetical protein ACM3ML_10595 [Micromonosporaceae bacterium]
MAGELWQRMLMEARAALETGERRTTARGTPIDIDLKNPQIPVESRLPVRDAAIACIGTSLIAAASLHDLRSGKRQRLETRCRSRHRRRAQRVVAAPRR